MLLLLEDCPLQLVRLQVERSLLVPPFPFVEEAPCPPCLEFATLPSAQPAADRIAAGTWHFARSGQVVATVQREVSTVSSFRCSARNLGSV